MNRTLMVPRESHKASQSLATGPSRAENPPSTRKWPPKGTGKPPSGAHNACYCPTRCVSECGTRAPPTVGSQGVKLQSVQFPKPVRFGEKVTHRQFESPVTQEPVSPTCVTKSQMTVLSPTGPKQSHEEAGSPARWAFGRGAGAGALACGPKGHPTVHPMEVHASGL